MTIIQDRALATRMTEVEARELAANLNRDDPEWTYRAGWLIPEDQAVAGRHHGIEVRDEDGAFLGYL